MDRKNLSYSERISICEKCEHFSSVGTCGTPVVGNTIIHNGVERKLCGCFMRIKAAIPALSCPLEKWSGHLTEDERVELHDWLKKAIETNTADITILYRWWNKANPKNPLSPSTCVPCVKKVMDDLWVKIKK